MVDTYEEFGGEDSKNRKDVRTLVLAQIDGKAPISSTGLIDRDLFTGGNNLRAIMDEGTTLWYMKYDKGILPPALRQKFTSFKALLEHATWYFNRRNIEIKEVID